MYDTYVLLKAEGIQFPPVNERAVDGILLETVAVSYDVLYANITIMLIFIIGA